MKFTLLEDTSKAMIGITEGWTKCDATDDS